MSQLKYYAAYLLAQAGGDKNPSADKIQAILESVGISVNAAAIEATIQQASQFDTEGLTQEAWERLSVFEAAGMAPQLPSA